MIFRKTRIACARPVKRVGETWQEISWQQAFAEIGQRTRAILAEDPDASAVYIGNPNAHSYGNALNAEYLSKALHTRNKFSASTVDQMPHQVANLRLFGHASLFGIPDIDRTQTLIILGGNPDGVKRQHLDRARFPQPRARTAPARRNAERGSIRGAPKPRAWRTAICSSGRQPMPSSLSRC